MTRKVCTKETLARGPLCSVELCSCGAIHVLVCSSTLSTDDSAGRVIAETLDEAMETLLLRELGLIRGSLPGSAFDAVREGGAEEAAIERGAP
ncbi:MAG: hypothetical protein HY698_20190 [Deltaproteobacteria bacterium]|nr:hypothetical protein [Deltaproteobacteria bacterium]